MAEVDIEISPGRTPPMLIINRRSARPMVAFARYRGRRPPKLLFETDRLEWPVDEHERRGRKCVEVATPCQVECGIARALAAAMTTGR